MVWLGFIADDHAFVRAGYWQPRSRTKYVNGCAEISVRAGHIPETSWMQEGIVQTETMTVTGMICGGCPIKLERALKAMIGVEDVQVSQASGEVTVRYDERRISPPQIKGIVISTGFGVDGIAATNGHDPRPDSCG
jgi:copper chaperone